ncbi:Inositol 2-dehydrogenase/D-chiro-inositol 3-dehydrogenase [Streptomyces violaceorubidus]
MSETPAVSRRLLLGSAAATGALAAGIGAAAPSASAAEQAPRRRPGQKSMTGVPFAAHRTVRVAVIGLGNRGGGMITGWAAVPGCTVTAVCDIRADRAQRAADRLESKGHPRPAEYGGSADSYARMLRRDDIDLVYVATPWEFHYEHGRAALLSGRHAVVELPIATELRQLWDLVDTSERTRRHLLLSENCNYGRNELAMLKAAHDGLFGDLTNGHGGYLHDLRELLFSDTYYTDSWRRLWHTRSTASFYPMHGLAPIAAAMDVNRGDRMTTLRATATAPKGLADYRARFVPRDHPSWKETYINGDLVTCPVIETAKGRTIRAEHDVSSPRPYSRTDPRGQPGHRRGLRRTRPDRRPHLRGAGPQRPHLARLRGLPQGVRPLAVAEGRRQHREQRRPRRHGLRPAVAHGPADARGSGYRTSTSTTRPPGARPSAQRHVAGQGRPPRRDPGLRRGRLA